MKKTYQVQLINRNLVIEVAEDQYILEAVEAAGQKLPVGCRYGVCTTCAARLLKGEISYTVHIKGDGTPEQFEQIHEFVKKTSPNYYNIANAIALNSELVVE